MRMINLKKRIRSLNVLQVTVSTKWLTTELFQHITVWLFPTEMAFYCPDTKVLYVLIRFFKSHLGAKDLLQRLTMREITTANRHVRRQVAGPPAICASRSTGLESSFLALQTINSGPHNYRIWARNDSCRPNPEHVRQSQSSGLQEEPASANSLLSPSLDGYTQSLCRWKASIFVSLPMCVHAGLGMVLADGRRLCSSA